METMGKRLERLRKSKKMTIKDLAKHAGVPPTTYRDWEYGSGIKGEPYPQLARALGVSLSTLFGISTPAQAEITHKIKCLKRELEALERDLEALF